MKEVLFISYKYPPTIGGMQKQSYELINEFNKNTTAHSIVWNQSGSLIIFFASLLWKVPITLINNRNIGLIHCNDGVCALLVSWLLAAPKFKLAVTYHGLDLIFPSIIYQKFLLGLIKKFDLIITVSDATRQACLDRGFDPQKTYTILNGVESEIEVNNSKVLDSDKCFLDNLNKANKKVLVSIGRPVKRKGFTWFIEEVLPKLSSNYVFILIGPYPSYNRLLERLIKYFPNKLQQQINLLFGRSTEHEKLIELSYRYTHKFIWKTKWDHNTKLYALQKANLFIMPNQKVNGDMEGFGLVALEANICGKYVCASNLEGITSAIKSNVNGNLVPFNDPVAWKESIELLTSNNSANSKSGIQARQYAKQTYSWKKMAQEYSNLFARVTSELNPLFEA